MTIVGVNHSLPILHMSKRMVHIYITEKTIHQFGIGYIINPSLHINRYSEKNVKRAWVVIFLPRQWKLLEII